MPQKIFIKRPTFLLIIIISTILGNILILNYQKLPILNDVTLSLTIHPPDLPQETQTNSGGSGRKSQNLPEDQPPAEPAQLPAKIQPSTQEPDNTLSPSPDSSDSPSSPTSDPGSSSPSTPDSNPETPSTSSPISLEEAPPHSDKIVPDKIPETSIIPTPSTTENAISQRQKAIAAVFTTMTLSFSMTYLYFSNPKV